MTDLDLDVIAACLPYSGADRDDAQALIDRLDDAGLRIVVKESINRAVLTLIDNLRDAGRIITKEEA